MVAQRLRNASPERTAAVAEMLVSDGRYYRSLHLIPKPLALRFEDLFRSAVRRTDRPAAIFRAWAATGPRVLALEEAKLALEVRGDRVPGRVVLDEIVAIGDHRLACLAAAVACEPCPRTWVDLLYPLETPLYARVQAVWRESDPDNAIAWYCGLDGVGPAYFHRMTNDEIVEAIRRGNACPELRLGEPFPVNFENYERAANLLEFLDYPSQIGAITRKDYLVRIASGVDATHRLLDGFSGQLVKQGRDVEAEACRAAVETMMRRFIVAPPREMEAVLAGCTIARKVLGGREDSARIRLRLNAVAKLDELIGLRFDEYSQRADDKTHPAWAKGLSRCTDEAAREMMAAIDEWDRTDQRLQAATDEEIALLDAVSPLEVEANK